MSMVPVFAATTGVIGVAIAAGIGIAAVAPTYRECIVEIANDCQRCSLINPRMHLTSGKCSKPLPFDIYPGTRDTAIFIKTPHTARGAVGVFTYDLLDSSTQTTETLAIMFSVPYDFNIYSNWFAVGIFCSPRNCDQALFSEMYYHDEHSFVRGEAKQGNLTYEHGNVMVMASMADTYKPFLRVKVKQI